MSTNPLLKQMIARRGSVTLEADYIPDVEITAASGDLLLRDLDFHGVESNYGAHNFHPFPAKFPPQLPKKFIESLTKVGDTVLDPMMGSGTTVVEAFMSNRAAFGFDIDPLAVRLAAVKTTPLDKAAVLVEGTTIVDNARTMMRNERQSLERELSSRWPVEGQRFIDYWFVKETQLELLALIKQIERVRQAQLRSFFEIALSGAIIAKSGGVSLALDLAHTRPHKAKLVYAPDGKVIMGKELLQNPTSRLPHLTKRLRSAIDEFEKRFSRNVQSLPEELSHRRKPLIDFGDAKNLPLGDESVDLIVTSPPYASNAIDYMRAHKFSLIWLGHDYGELSEKRNKYIGGESTSDFPFESLPEYTMSIIQQISAVDSKKGLVLHRYYSEMVGVLREMHRVLRAGRSTFVVVGNSVMRGIDTQTDKCLADIGVSAGFVCPMVGERNLDRNRRMLPAGTNIDRTSQIQQRMHKEYVVSLTKPND
jgi:DNA modification methylase